MGGSKRNALLKWCQNKLQSYPVSNHLCEEIEDTVINDMVLKSVIGKEWSENTINNTQNKSLS